MSLHHFSGSWDIFHIRLMSVIRRQGLTIATICSTVWPTFRIGGHLHIYKSFKNWDSVCTSEFHCRRYTAWNSLHDFTCVI